MRLHQGGKSPWYPIEQTLRNLTLGDGGRILVALLGKLYAVPDLEYFAGILGGAGVIAEHVGMAANQLLIDVARNVRHGEGTSIRRDLRVQNHLHEHIAKLLAQMDLVILFDAVDGS